MKKHEEHLDELLKEILKEGALETPETKQYTPAVMTSIYAQERKKERIKQFIYGTLGILAGLTALVGVILLWQNGLLTQFAATASNYLRNISLMLPLKLTPVLLTGILLHHLANGGFIVAYFIKRKHTKFS